MPVTKCPNVQPPASVIPIPTNRPATTRVPSLVLLINYLESNGLKSM